MKRISWLVIGISIFATVIPTIVFIYYYHYYSLISSSIKKVDKFGIKKIYPTTAGGREWFVDMDNPFVDNLFYSTFHRNITRQDDGSWRIGGSAVRLNVITPSGAKLWKNIEITGYAKIVGTIDIDGNVRWKKEIWHTGGYTDARAADNVTDSILDRWIGWKVVMYNIYNDTAVKMESYLDDKNNNNWTKVTDVIDNGGWYARSADNIFYSANCGRPKDYIITNGGSIVTFRADGIVWDFKNLSVREIQPPDM